MIEGRSRLAESEAHAVALDCIEAGIEAATPQRVLQSTLDLSGDVLTVADTEYDLAAYDSVMVLGGGKAADVVARELESLLEDYLDTSLVVSNNPVDTDRVEVVEGAHPVPDEAGEDGAQRVLDHAQDQGEGSLVLVPVTGGGSALLPSPAGAVSLDDLQTVTEQLVDSGAAIEEINAVRKHLSAIKGGGLAQAAAPATVVGLLFSDVVGDDPGVVGSGPTAPDETTFADAVSVLDFYDIDVPAAVESHLESGVEGEREETPTSDSGTFERVDNHVLATNRTAIDAAREVAREAGYDPLVLSSHVRGEATESALTHLAIAEECQERGDPIEAPAVLISGGETTVTVLGNRKGGGPNMEFALRVAIEGREGVVCAAVDTDGEDGGTDAAGAIVDGSTVTDAMKARVALVENRSYRALDDRLALIRTGPTDTNVNDLRVFVIE